MQKPIRKPRERGRDRHGTTLVATVISLLAFILVVLGMLDLGIGVMRSNTVSEAARIGARMAIVHGSKAPTAAGFGGPWDGANDAVAIKARIAPLLNAEGVATDSIIVTVAHTDGPDTGTTTTNDPGDLVTVTVTAPYRPVLSIFFGSSTQTLTGRSRMAIAH